MSTSSLSIIAKSWPFIEAQKLLEHITRKGKVAGDVVTFETGYGPSGAPHIGTFGEVIRTLWVMRAFNELTDNAYNTRLIMFSDDYDGMRKVPDGLPEWMNDHLGKPLCDVPNPYGTSETSFSEANNMRLVEFVDQVLMQYDGSTVGSSPDCSKVSFVSSSKYYKLGKFNTLLEKVWDNYDAIQTVMLPTLGEDRRTTYSPFMPVMTPEWWPYGQVLQVPIRLVSDYQIAFEVPDDAQTRMVGSIHNGLVKLQWKVDWAMRWTFFDVDYEMSGKDLIDSVRASAQICKVLGGVPPLNLTYELFLDADGKKISKTVGNGFSIEGWLKYGTMQSLALFMFQNPRAAKPIHIELVPRLEDEYYKAMSKTEFSYDDPVWHIHAGQVNRREIDVNFSLLLNMAMVSNSTIPDILVSYLEQNRQLPASEYDEIHEMAGRVIQFMIDTGRNVRELRPPTEQEANAFDELASRYEAMMPHMDAEAFQYQVYEVGKAHGFDPLRNWFKALYECLLGSPDGPRFGAFTAAYGLENTIELLRSVKVTA